MQKTLLAALLSVMLGLGAGCATLAPPVLESLGLAAPASASSLTAQASDPAGLEGCEVLGLVTANAECACYDRMSYEHLKGQASSNVLKAARSQYPDSNVVRVSSVDLYLNNAVAHGVAYRCALRNRS